MSGAPIDPQLLLPQKKPMMFVREILELSESATRCLVVPGEPPIPGYDGPEISCEIGVEYMAQCAALASGCSFRASSAPVPDGAVVALREIVVSADYFRAHVPLRATAELSGTAGAASTFICSLVESDTGRELMSGKFTVMLQLESQ
ncbi:MAG: hypothetical protein U0136_12470 [Bdellovibrionota bacterium]